MSVGFFSVTSIEAFADSLENSISFYSPSSQYIDIESPSSNEGRASLQATITGKVLSQADCGGVIAYIAETQNQIVGDDGTSENEIVCYFAPKEGDSGEITTLDAFTSSSMYCRDKIHRIISKGDIKLTVSGHRIEQDGGYIVDNSALSMFGECTKLTDISGLTNWDISGTSVFYYFFANCKSLTDLSPLANWNMSGVTSLTGFFSGCEGLSNLNGLQNWNLNNVTDLSCCFSRCKNLSDISALSRWNISNVRLLRDLFSDCSSLASVDALSNWNTGNVRVASELFSGCTNLTSISGLAKWDLSKVASISRLFCECKSLEDISSVSNWKLGSCYYLDSVFKNCTSLKDATAVGTWKIYETEDTTYIPPYSFDGFFHGCCNLVNVDLRFLSKEEFYQTSEGAYISYLFGSSLTDPEEDYTGCRNVRKCILPLYADIFKSAASQSSLKVENLWEWEHKAYQYKLYNGTLIDTTDELVSVWDTYNLGETTIEIVEKEPTDIDIDDPSPENKVLQLKVNVTAGTGTIKINGQELSAGSVAEIDASEDMTVSWTPTVQNSTNFSFVSSLKINGVEQTSASNIDKSAWATTNSEYKRRMNQNAKMVTFDNVKKASQTITVKSSELASLSASETSATIDTIDVEFKEVVPVYRLYNMITSEHLFTTDKAEYDSWVAKCKNDKDYWIGEGIDWFAPKTYSASTAAKVYRLYNPGLGAMGRSSHYYTSDVTEMNNLVKNFGWKKETQFSGGYVFLSDKTDSAVPIWTCYNEALGSAHHYTSDKTEWSGLKKHGWDLETKKNGTKGVFAAAMSAK